MLQTLSELLTDYEEVLSDCVSAGKTRDCLESIFLGGICLKKYIFGEQFIFYEFVYVGGYYKLRGC